MRQAMLISAWRPTSSCFAARRTRETLDALQPWDEAPLIEPMDELYLATAAQLLEVLREMPETARSVMLIGHNPGLHDLALRLVGRGDAAGSDPGIRPGAGCGWRTAIRPALWPNSASPEPGAARHRRRPTDPVPPPARPAAGWLRRVGSLSVLELVLAPDDADRLLRLKPLLELRTGRIRRRASSLVWHDTVDGALAVDGLALVQSGGAWWLERLFQARCPGRRARRRR